MRWFLTCAPGPLDRARSTAARYGLAERMEFRLCDGLSGIAPAEADTIAIAGMGGETIAAILAAAPWVREQGCLAAAPAHERPERPAAVAAAAGLSD